MCVCVHVHGCVRGCGVQSAMVRGDYKGVYSSHKPPPMLFLREREEGGSTHDLSCIE